MKLFSMFRISPKIKTQMARSLVVLLLICLSVFGGELSASAEVAVPPTVAGDPSLKTYFGETIPMGDGTISSYVTLDSKGNPYEIGVTFPEAALSNLPKRSNKLNEGELFLLSTPPEAAPTHVKSIEVFWLPNGHVPPGVWDVPQLAMHYNFLTRPELDQVIDPDKFYLNPPEGYLPAGHIVLPESGIPKSSAHAADPNLPEFNGGTYLRHFMYMVYDGHVIGLEPNITLRYLKMKPRSLDGLQVPKLHEQAGYYPSFSRINYDAATKTYTLALDGFKKFTAAKS